MAETRRADYTMSVHRLNQLELQQGLARAETSWHRDFKDTNTVYVGHLPQEMNEHDLLILFSQYGVPTDVVIARDRCSGRSRGFGWITYEDWESTVLAVDNFDSWPVAPGHVLRVNHAYYRDPYAAKKEPEREDGPDQNWLWQQHVRAELLDKDVA